MKSGADRKRAARYRERLSSLTPEERRWLADYDGTKGASPIGRRAPPPVQSAAPPPQPRQEPVQSVAPPPAPVQSPVQAPPPTPQVEPIATRVVDFGSDTPPAPMPPANPGTSISPAVKCGCLACKRRSGTATVKCLVTGEEVAPALSLDGARGIATGIMGLCTFGGRVLRGVEVRAEAHEVTALAKAMVSMSERREQLGFVGQWDDLFAFAFVLLSFLARVWNAEKVAPS